MNVSKREKARIEDIYLEYADLLYRVAVAHLSNSEDAQDAVQDVFIKYMMKAPIFLDKEHEKAWLLRVTVNCCHDIARHRKKRDTLPLESAFDVVLEDNSTVGVLLDEISQIPEKYRNIIILHCLEGLTLQETANVLHISLSAAKMRLLRARDALRKVREE